MTDRTPIVSLRGIGVRYDGAEALRDGPAQRLVLVHQAPRLAIRIVDRRATLGEEAADGALAAADAARDPHLHHGSAGLSISGTGPIEMNLISLMRSEMAFCNDWGSITSFPSCPSSRETA